MDLNLILLLQVLRFLRRLGTSLSEETHHRVEQTATVESGSHPNLHTAAYAYPRPTWRSVNFGSKRMPK